MIFNIFASHKNNPIHQMKNNLISTAAHVNVDTENFAAVPFSVSAIICKIAIFSCEKPQFGGRDY